MNTSTLLLGAVLFLSWRRQTLVLLLGAVSLWQACALEASNFTRRHSSTCAVYASFCTWPWPRAVWIIACAPCALNGLTYLHLNCIRLLL